MEFPDWVQVKVRRFIAERSTCCLIVKYDSPAFYEFFSSVSVKDFQNVFRLQ